MKQFKTNFNHGLTRQRFHIHLPKTKKLLEGLSNIDWSLHLPTPETQKYTWDTNACMTYSSLNVIETFLNYLKATGQIPQSVLSQCETLGYFDVSGKFNFSDRFSAIMNGTIPSQGNNFDAVWNGYENYGILPDKDFSYSLEQSQVCSSQQEFWDDFYNGSLITQEMKNKALLFNKMFSVDKRWIIASGINGIALNFWNLITNRNHHQVVTDSLSDSVIQLGIPACPTWNTGNVQVCDIMQAQHGVECYRTSANLSYSIYDQYNPFIKTLAPNYTIPYAVAVKVSVKSKPEHTFTSNLQYGLTNNNEVLWLQRCLAYMGYFKGISPTGNYMGITAGAVYAFQVDNKVDTPEVLGELKGYNVGPKTRAKLNELFSKQT